MSDFPIGRAIVARPIPAGGGGTTQLPAATNRFYDFTTDSANIADGFFGIYEQVDGSGNGSHISTTPTPGAHLEFIHRDKSAIITPGLSRRPFEKLGYISPRSLCGVKLTVQNAQLSIDEIHAVDFPLGLTTAPFEIQDNYAYNIVTRATGDTIDWVNSSRTGGAGKNVTYLTPDFTTAGIVDQAARDLILANLAFNHNNQSNPGGNVHVAFNLSTVIPFVGAQTINQIIAARIAAGANTVVRIGYNLAGIADTLTITQQVLAALQAIAANTALRTDVTGAGVAFGGLYLVPYLLPGTTTLPALVPVAGSRGATIAAQFMAFVSLDYSLATYQDRNDVKTGMILGLNQGFTNARQTKMVSSQNTIGDTNSVRLGYIETNYRKYSEDAGRDYEYLVRKYANEIIEGAFYDQFTITWCQTPIMNGGGVSQWTRSITIYIPNYTIGNAEVNSVFDFNGTGLANPHRAWLVARLNGFNTQNLLGNPALV